MIQEQLVDYISSQMKLGVSQDAIKTTLVSAGWPVADVEDTFKKVNGATPAIAAQAAKPLSSFSSPMGMGTSQKMPDKNPEPQTIKVSDLVSPASMGVAASGAMASSPATAKVSPLSNRSVLGSPLTNSQPVTKSDNKKMPGGNGMVTIVLVLLIIIFAGAAGYFFYENMALSSKVGSVNSQSQSVSSQVASLNTQIQTLTSSSANMSAQVMSLTTSNQTLKTELSFFVVPIGNTPTTTSLSISGTVSLDKTIFFITTVDGAKLSIKNSLDSGVRSTLQPLVVSSATAQITGTYLPGSSIITVLTVNGISVYTPSANTTSTAATSSNTL